MAEEGELERSHSRQISESGSLYLSAGDGASFTSTEYYDFAADNAASLEVKTGSQDPKSDVPEPVSTTATMCKETAPPVPSKDVLGVAMNGERPEQGVKTEDATDVAVDDASVEVDTREPNKQEFTKADADDLNKELAELLADLGLESNKYFNRPLDDFPTLADFYEQLGVSLGKDGCDLDISQTLATRLGDNANVVVELRRREYLEDVRQLDNFIKDSLGEDVSSRIFVSKPQDFANPLKYYTSCQLLAKEHGEDLLPLIKQKMGEEHPLVIALSGEKPGQSLGWHAMRKREVSELPISAGGELLPMSGDLNTDVEKPQEESEKMATENETGAAKAVERAMPREPVRDETAEPRAVWCCFCGRSQ